MDGSTGNPRQQTGALNRDLLGPSEVAVFEKHADRNGIVHHPDIDFLLRQNAFLRQQIGLLVASAGKPKKDGEYGGWFTTVPADKIENLALEGEYSGLGLEDEEPEFY